MCGRNSLFHDLETLEERFNARSIIDRYRPRYNIAPSQSQPVIANTAPEDIVEQRWGLLPHWLDDPGNGFINARSETAHEKPAFRDAWSKRPCLVLSSGFYEWQRPNGGPKQPYRIHRRDGAPFAMAGLWEEWTDEEGTPLRTFTILTTDANDLIEPIHDRMPVVLRAGRERGWLEGDSESRHRFCAPYPDDDLVAYPIDTAVNNPQNDHAGIIEPAQREQAGLGDFGA